jgi:tRNA/rRNA methyltransferase
LLAEAEEFATVAEAVADCALVVGTTALRHRELQHPLRRLEEGAKLIRRRMQSQRVALLFGSEKTGLSNEALSHCHWLMRIPTREEHGSMNLGQAVAVCLYELVRDSRVPAKVGRVASAEESERLTGLLVEALAASGYLKPHPAPAAVEKIRRMVRRLSLNESDAEVLLGMMRQILWKLKRRD